MRKQQEKPSKVMLVRGDDSTKHEVLQRGAVEQIQ